jgi:hypothetical protein
LSYSKWRIFAVAWALLAGSELPTTHLVGASVNKPRSG